MAIVVKVHIPGMSVEAYESVVSQLETVGSANPPGRLYHVAYGSAGNVQVLDVYDSLLSFENFGKTLFPLIEPMGIEFQPEVHEVFNIMEG